MPEPYGLTSTGFSAPTFEELRDKVNQKIWRTISTTLDLSDRTYEGIVIAAVCEQIILQWEMGEDSQGVLDPDEAADAALDAVCLLTGTFRRGAFASKISLTLTGNDASPVPINSISGVVGGLQFKHDAAATLVALAAWLPVTLYGLNERVTNGGNCYICITAGVTAGAGGPTTTDPDIIDGAAHWRFLGEGVAAADVAATATVAGRLSANSGTVTDIVTPVGGWLGVINILDALSGADQMKDEDLRQLREIELAKAGTGPIDAIEADLLDKNNIPGVRAVMVFNNPSDVTDVDGMPPHSVEALVLGGDDQDIWNQLHKSVGGGIRTHGTEVGTVLDRRGRAHVYRFSRPAEVPIFIALTVKRQPSTAPADLATQVKNSVVDLGGVNTNGKDAVASRISSKGFVHDCVSDVTALIGIAPAPVSSATIPISLRQIAGYDTSRITVAFVDGEP